VAAYFVMHALVLHEPSSGSFVTYARKFIGPWAGFASGWMYWVNWAMTGLAEITAVAIYVHKWLPDVPQWITALVALGVLPAVNVLSVKLFGELEFWFSVVKVLAIVVFLITALGLVFTGADIGGTPAGETKDAREVLPKAINSVVWRIGVFYVGSVRMLAILLPWPFYNGDESPFVTVFSRLGIPGIGDVMNAVVLTAALSSVNSGLYSTGRILRSLADKREAPAFVGRMSSRQVPYGGILFTSIAYLLGVVLNYLVPKRHSTSPSRRWA
jgi:L-asparagine permease